MKKKTILVLAAVLCLGSSMTACAEPKAMPDGTVFDAEYYAENNPDVAAVCGADANLLYMHYLNFGRTEGRKPCSDSFLTTEADNSIAASTVKIEADDLYYLEAGRLGAGLPWVTFINTDYDAINQIKWDKKPETVVRADWSAHPLYQAMKQEILALKAAGLTDNGFDGYSALGYTADTVYYEDCWQAAWNLSIDLVKEGTLDRCYMSIQFDEIGSDTMRCHFYLNTNEIVDHFGAPVPEYIKPYYYR